ncbi:hypothetical protein HQ545_01575 [Candidatus Woesearchaeota archaeon]|nr:hypothetical protein [Candidatus Woesearchaeota archaeon]
MFKKRSKKAISHVDWAMSLGIFLLYLAWFFIFVKPLLFPSESMGVLLDIIEDGVENTIFEDLERVRVSVQGDNEHEPIIIPFSHDWQGSISNTAGRFVIDEGRMFFLANLSQESNFDIYHPHDALVLSVPPVVIADEERAVSGVFSAFFKGGLIDRIIYDGVTRITEFSVEVDGNLFDGEGVFNNMDFMAKYAAEDENTNISSYVYANNHRVDMFFTSRDSEMHSMAIELSTFNYTSYHVNPSAEGDIDYGLRSSCRYYESDIIDLYDSGSSLMLRFSSNATFRLCTNESDAIVGIEFDLAPDVDDRLTIIMGEGSYDSEVLPSPVVGVTETLRTVSSDKLSNLKNREYGYLKTLLRYPSARDFNITVRGGISASYGVPVSDSVNVYARRIEGIVIDEYHLPERVSITMSVW